MKFNYSLQAMCVISDRRAMIMVWWLESYEAMIMVTLSEVWLVSAVTRDKC